MMKAAMRIVIVACVGLMACGTYVLLRHPNALLVGITLIVIPAVILIQAALTALAMRFSPWAISRPEALAPRDGLSELTEIQEAYDSLRVFLARMVGFVATVYGIVTFQVYFFALGVAVVVLFWIWDRMYAADESTTEGPLDGETPVSPRNGHDRR